MKILLVYPIFPETYWSFRHALSFVGKKAAFPPLGLLTVSAMLPENWERRLVDMNVEPLSKSDIEWADNYATSLASLLQLAVRTFRRAPILSRMPISFLSVKPKRPCPSLLPTWPMARRSASIKHPSGHRSCSHRHRISI